MQDNSRERVFKYPTNSILNVACDAFVSELHAIAIMSAPLQIVVATVCVTFLQQVSPLALAATPAQSSANPSDARPVRVEHRDALGGETVSCEVAVLINAGSSG